MNMLLEQLAEAQDRGDEAMMRIIVDQITYINLPHFIPVHDETVAAMSFHVEGRREALLKEFGKKS